MNPPGLSPITKLFRSVSRDERMGGILVRFGPREAAKEPSAPRIVFVPTGGPLQAPDHAGNQTDFACAVECQCWGRDFDQLWEVVRRLLCAVDDYGYENGDEPADTTADGVADCVRPNPVEIEFDEEPDTNRQGWYGAVTFELVTSYEYTQRSTDGGIETIENVTVQPE